MVTACPCHVCTLATCWAIWRWRRAKDTARMLTSFWRPSVRKRMKCCPSSITARLVSTVHLCRLAIGSVSAVALLPRPLGFVTCQLRPSLLNSTVQFRNTQTIETHTDFSTQLKNTPLPNNYQTLVNTKYDLIENSCVKMNYYNGQHVYQIYNNLRKGENPNWKQLNDESNPYK